MSRSTVGEVIDRCLGSGVTAAPQNGTFEVRRFERDSLAGLTGDTAGPVTRPAGMMGTKTRPRWSPSGSTSV